MKTVTAKLLGRVIHGEGASLLEALSSVRYDGFPRVMSVWTVGTQSVIVPAAMTARVFSKNPNVRDLALIQLSERFYVA